MLEKRAAETLLEQARRARGAAYAPYSGFRVGAALLGSSGRVYAGCNVENVSFGATLCAERAAVAAAMAAGERTFLALAVSAGEGEAIVPCGVCRQVLAEFSKDGALQILCDDPAGGRTFLLRELLPLAFASFTPEEKQGG